MIFLGSITASASAPIEKGTWASHVDAGLLHEEEASQEESAGAAGAEESKEALAEGGANSEEREFRKMVMNKLVGLVHSGVCRAEDIKHDGVMRALMTLREAESPSAAQDKLDHFLKITLSQRVAGEEAFKTGQNSLLAFLNSDDKALSNLVPATATKVLPSQSSAHSALPFNTVCPIMMLFFFHWLANSLCRVCILLAHGSVSNISPFFSCPGRLA